MSMRLAFVGARGQQVDGRVSGNLRKHSSKYGRGTPWRSIYSLLASLRRNGVPNLHPASAAY